MQLFDYEIKAKPKHREIRRSGFLFADDIGEAIERVRHDYAMDHEIDDSTVIHVTQPSHLDEEDIGMLCEYVDQLLHGGIV